jgi:hypothetical protein
MPAFLSASQTSLDAMRNRGSQRPRNLIFQVEVATSRCVCVSLVLELVDGRQKGHGCPVQSRD